MSTLRETLTYEPRELRFGTSGRRGAVADLTQLEIYINVRGELDYLRSLVLSEGGVRHGDEFYFAYDLRPSSAAICRAAVEAIRDAGMVPVNMGAIPTPAVILHALSRGCGSIMVTGSHIPFDLNGYKLNRSTGELLKEHETPINEAAARVRARIYGEPIEISRFDANGALRDGGPALPAFSDIARSAYLKRYADFFPRDCLAGEKIVVYQHSAVGRDLLVEILRHFGADVFPAGRSDSFVAIDTEAIDDERLSQIRSLLDGLGPTVRAAAVVSVDGDSDRPLVLGIENGELKFFGGDLVGMVTAEFLGADAVVVPITCNDAIDRGPLAAVLEPKTKIGSPYVVAGIDKAVRRGRKAVCGWEANGGFLLGSGIERDGRRLGTLPTRDAFLPILSVLCAARRKGLSVCELFAELPRRFSKAALLRNFSREKGKKLVDVMSDMQCNDLQQFFAGREIRDINRTDGVRILFTNGEIEHFRPSGNADEFRVYAVADSQARADEIAAAGTADPGGTVRALERALLQ